MQAHEIEERLEFLKAAEGLKRVVRSAKLSDGAPESSAAHSWRLALWVLVFRDQMAGLDVMRLLELAIVHDLGEAISGDIPAIADVDKAQKEAQERADLEALYAPLPVGLRQQFWALWEEYEAAETEEAKWIKGLDKLETMVQHNQGSNDPDFDYVFNLTYGLEHTDRVELLAQIRVLIDAETAAHGGR